MSYRDFTPAEEACSSVSGSSEKSISCESQCAILHPCKGGLISRGGGEEEKQESGGNHHQAGVSRPRSQDGRPSTGSLASSSSLHWLELLPSRCESTRADLSLFHTCIGRSRRVEDILDETTNLRRYIDVPPPARGETVVAPNALLLLLPGNQAQIIYYKRVSLIKPFRLISS
jgi:hypothetical protein